MPTDSDGPFPRVEPKEYLRRIEAQNKAIEEKCAELYHLKSMCEKTTTSFSDAPKGAGGTDREDLYIRYAELRDEINSDIDRLTEMQKPIYAVKNETLRELLICRYIKRWKWERIAEEIGRTVDMTRIKLHYRAQEELNTIYCEND